jgi:hypothetical protein
VVDRANVNDKFCAVGRFSAEGKVSGEVKTKYESLF